MDGKMRNTLIASVVGGVCAVGLCVYLTAGAANSMQQQAANTLATIGSTNSSASSAQVVSSSAASSAPSSSATSSSTAASSSASGSSTSDGSSSSASGYGGATTESSTSASQSGASSSGSTSSASSASTPGVVPDPGTAVQVDPATGAEYKGKIYHVQWGDTLSSISDALGWSVQELAEFNHITDVDMIYADSALRVPEQQSN